VGKHQAAAPHQGQQPVEIVHVAILVGVEKQDVERILQLRDRLMGVALDDGRQVRDAGLAEMLARRRGPAPVVLERGQAAARLVQGQAKPHPGNAGGSADLDHVLCIACLRQQAQEAAVGGGHVGVGRARLPRLFDRVKDSLFRVGIRQRHRIGIPAAGGAEAAAEAALRPGGGAGNQGHQCGSSFHGLPLVKSVPGVPVPGAAWPGLRKLKTPPLEKGFTL